MDSINLDQVAAVLDVLGKLAGESPVQWLSIASIVLLAAGTVLRRIRASRQPMAVVEAKAVEAVKEVDVKPEFKLDDLLPKK